MPSLAPCTGTKYGSRNVLADPDIREGIKAFTKWPTVPQVATTGRQLPDPAGVWQAVWHSGTVTHFSFLSCFMLCASLQPMHAG